MNTPQQQLYDDMVADIIVITRRPELQEKIELYLRQATMSAHSVAFFPRDLVVKPVQLPNTVNLFAIDIPSLLPRMRALESVQAIDSQGNVVFTPAIKVVEVGDVYDPEYPNMLRNNIAYVGGSTLNIRAGITGACMVSYYAAPNTRRDYYSSWIAQLAPDVITQWAAALLYNDTGDDAKAQQKFRMLDDQRGNGLIPDLKRNYLLAQAH